MKLQKAYTYLADVQEKKQIIPFRRYAGGIGRASQAKQFGTTKGPSRSRSVAAQSWPGWLRRPRTRARLSAPL